MKRVALSMIVFLAVLLSACAIPPTDLSGIKVGATRATVEGVLGKPVKSVQTDSWRIDTYKYNMGYTPGPLPNGGGFLTLMVNPIVHSNWDGRQRQRGDIEVAYGPDDTVVGFYRVPGNIEEVRRQRGEILPRAEQGDAEAQVQVAMLSSSAAEQLKWFCLAANQGHAEALFQLYSRDKPDEKSLTWLCLAANQGHALAQEERGDLHVQGLGQAWREAGLVKLDHVRAYMWYSLAAANGEPRAGYRSRPLYIRDDLADQMTPAQIAEAERLAAEWKPGDCGAEGSPTKPTG